MILVALTLQFGRVRWSASWPMTLLTAAAVIAFILLGRWQWHRADERRALVASFNAGIAAAVPLQGRSGSELPRYAHVRVRGRYDPAHQFLLEDMAHGEQVGYQVLTPLQLTDGRTVIVNRGWVPMVDASYTKLPDVSFISPEEISVIGRLDSLPPAGLSLGHVPPKPGPHWPKPASFPTMADLASALGHPLMSRQLLLDPGQPMGYVRDWHPGGLSTLGHLSYALQWWSFAALALVLYGFLNRRRSAP